MSKSSVRLRYCGAPRTIREEDVQKINGLQHEIFVAEYIHVQANHCWLAEYSGKPVGFCALHAYAPNTGTVFLSLCGVLRAYRGQGLQRRMIQARLRLAIRLGYIRAITYTAYENTSSANNLIECGFRLYRPRWEWGLKNGIYLRKMLGE